MVNRKNTQELKLSISLLLAILILVFMFTFNGPNEGKYAPLITGYVPAYDGDGGPGPRADPGIGDSSPSDSIESSEPGTSASSSPNEAPPEEIADEPIGERLSAPAQAQVNDFPNKYEVQQATCRKGKDKPSSPADCTSALSNSDGANFLINADKSHPGYIEGEWSISLSNETIINTVTGIVEWQTDGDADKEIIEWYYWDEPTSSYKLVGCEDGVAIDPDEDQVDTCDLTQIYSTYSSLLDVKLELKLIRDGGKTNFLTNYLSISLNSEILDTTPPAKVTDLGEVSAGKTWIYWNWTNPVDADFSQNIIYIDGNNVANTSNNYYNATNLISKSNYQIKIHTADTSGNINLSAMTDTAKTILYFYPNITIKDADGNSMNMYLEIKETGGGKLKYNGENNRHEFEIDPNTTYDIKITPTGNIKIKEINIPGYVFKGSISELIDIDDVPEDGFEFSEIFAINPLQQDLPSFNVTVTATGDIVDKCAEWDFATRTCLGSWVEYQNITPGKNYTITILGTDPGFGESITGTAGSIPEPPEESGSSGGSSGGSPSTDTAVPETVEDTTTQTTTTTTTTETQIVDTTQQTAEEQQAVEEKGRVETKLTGLGTSFVPKNISELESAFPIILLFVISIAVIFSRFIKPKKKKATKNHRKRKK